MSHMFWKRASSTSLSPPAASLVSFSRSNRPRTDQSSALTTSAVSFTNRVSAEPGHANMMHTHHFRDRMCFKATHQRTKRPQGLEGLSRCFGSDGPRRVDVEDDADLTNPQPPGA